jgi:hypothetical protein
VIGINDSKVWGTIVRDEGSVFRLDSGRVVKKSTYKTVWCYLEEFSNIKQTLRDLTRMCFEEVAEKNSLISYKINLLKPLHHFNLYLLQIMKDGTYTRVDEWEIHEVEEMVVSARGPEEAKALAATCEYLADTEHYWKEPRYILCELLGKSYKSEAKIISVSRHDIAL